MTNLKRYCFRRIAMVLVLALMAAMLPVAVPVSAAETDYPVLELDTQTTVTITGGSRTYLAFTPAVNCTYEFYSVYGTSTGYSDDTYGYLYDENFNLINANDDGKGNRQFRIVQQLEAGRTYYLAVRYYYDSYSGSFDVVATAVHSFTTEIVEEATCSAPGLKLYSCSCGYSYTEAYTIDHVYEAGFCVDCGAMLSASGFCGENVTWSLDGTVLSIFGTGPMEGVYYISDVPWYPYRSSIESVIIEDGITSIFRYAFWENVNLLECDIPATVENIGYGAFNGCTSLTDIVIPDACTTIDSYAFSGCTGLTQIHIPANVTSMSSDSFRSCTGINTLTVDSDNPVFMAEDNILYSRADQTLMFAAPGLSGTVVVPDGIVTIAEDAFRDCINLEAITIADSVTSIGNQAFLGCTALSSVVLPSGLTQIGMSLFYNCSALKEIVIPAGVTVINNQAFQNCTSLETVVLQEGLQKINYAAFNSCSSLQTMEFPESLSYIGGSVFTNCIGLETMALPASLTSIQYSTFAGCSALREIQIPDSVTTIGSWAFEACSSLQEITLPDSLTSIDDYAFSGCTALKEIVIPNSVVRLWEGVFSNCTSLEKVVLSDQITYLDDYLFDGCSSLKEIELPECLETISNRVFADCYMMTELSLPAGLRSLYSSAFDGCASLCTIRVHEDNPYFFTDNGMLYYRDSYGNQELVLCPKSASGTVSVLDGTRYIEAYAFSDCLDLTEVDLPDSLVSIYSNAFARCQNLRDVDLPYNLEVLNWYSFQDCGALETITIPASLDTLSSVAHYSYNKSLNCTSLQSVIFQGDAPEIGTATFYGDSFTAYYPAGNSTWTDDQMYSYGGDITWIPYGDQDLVATGAYAESEWTLKTDGVLTISGSGVSRKNWDNYWDSIQSVVVEAGITEIGANTFTGIGDTASVKFLGDAPSFDETAFADAVTIAYYPADNASWTEEVRRDYGGTVFWTTGAEHEVVRSGQCGEDVFWTLDLEGQLKISGEGAMWDYIEMTPEWEPYSAMIKEVIVEEGVTTIGDYAFSASGEVSNVQLPDSVYDIGYCSFWNCSKLTSVELPQQLDSIDGRAFLGTGLTELELPETLSNLGGESLGSCEALDYVRFTGDAPTIGYNAFFEDTVTAYYPLKNDTWTDELLVDYGGTVTWVGEFIRKEIASGWSGNTNWTLTNDGVLTVYGSGKMKNYGYGGGQPWLDQGVDITSVVIEEGVEGVGSGAFKDLTTLKSVKLPESLTQMGEAAFYGSGLETIEIPAGLWTIQPYTFKNCADLTSVTFHEGNLQKISDGAFYGTGLTELVLPDCLDILDVYAFKGCADLTSITIGSGLTELREAVFYGTAIPTITIPEGITKIGPYAFKNCVALETIDLPESLTSIGEASFYADTALREVILPNAVTAIGNYAFRKCAAIEELVLSEELTTIGECAFYGCTGLSELVIPDQVTTIKPYAFKTCTGLTSVVLGESVKTIGEGAFNTCTGLKTIVFPASLEAIDDYAFSGSYNLWKLTFEGNAPAIGTGAFKGLDAYAYYPSGNTTWNSSNMLNYGGKLTWKAQ